MGLHNELQGEVNAVVTNDTYAYAAPQAGGGTEWEEPPALMIDEAGIILKCTASCEKLFGQTDRALASQHVSSLFPQLSGHQFMMGGRLNPMIDFLCHCGHRFAAQNSRGETFYTELSLVQVEDHGRRLLRLIARPLTNQPGTPSRDQIN